MSSKKIKIGWIGSGFVGQVAHLNLYEDIPNVEIVALSELRESLGKKVMQKNFIPKFYKDYNEMLQNEILDGVVLIVHRNHTAYFAEDILKKKFNLFTEKPQAPTYEVAKKLVSIASKNNLKYVSGLMRRHDDGIKYSKKEFNNLLKSKKFGKLIGAEFFCFAGGDYCDIGNYQKTKEPRPIHKLCEKYPNWLNNYKGKQYEEFLNVYIHDIDLINYFFGKDVKVLNVNFSFEKMSYINMFANDIPISFKFRKLNSNHWAEGYSLIFEKGIVDVELKPAFLKNTSSSVNIKKLGKGGLINDNFFENFSFKWSFKNQHLDFIKSLMNKKYKPISSCSETLNSFAIVDQIFKKI